VLYKLIIVGHCLDWSFIFIVYSKNSYLWLTANIISTFLLIKAFIFQKANREVKFADGEGKI
jgi:hypothetical protein